MAANGLVRVVMQVTGLAQLRAALRGAVAENRRADDTMRRSHETTERAKRRVSDEGARENRRRVRERVREELSAEEQIAREQQRHRRDRERAMRRQMRDERRGSFEGMGAGQTVRAMAGAAGVGAVAAGAMTALQAFADRMNQVTDALERRAGVEDVGTRTASAQDFELTLARSSGEFFQGQSPEQMQASMAALREEIAGIAVEAGQSPNDLLNVLSTMQTEFSQFDAGRENLRAIALEAQRTGADMTQLARFIGVLNHQLGETAPSAEEAFDIMAQQGLAGAITPEQLASEFGGMFGQFRDTSGLQGAEALRQFGGIANALKTKDMGVAETATLMQNLFTAVGNSETRARLQIATGGRARRVRGADGRMHTRVEGGTQAFREDGTIDFMRLIEDMATVDQIGTSDVVFHDAQARQAAGQLVALQRRNAAGEDVMTAAELAGVSREAGGEFRRGSLATVMGTGAVAMERIAAQSQVEGIQNLANRESSAIGQSAFRQAAIATGMDSVMAPLSWLPFHEQMMSGAAGLASNLTASQRTGVSQFGGLANMAGGLPFAGVASAAMQGLLGMSNLGDRTKQIEAQARGTQVSLAEGSRVEIADASIDRLASRVGTQVRGGAPQAGRTPGEPQR